jgi:hypothetical protein
LELLERRVAEAAGLAAREAKDALARLDVEATEEVAARLAGRRKRAEAALIEAAAPLLDDLLAVQLAQEALGQHAVRREKAAAVMADCAGVGPPTDLA